MHLGRYSIPLPILFLNLCEDWTSNYTPRTLCNKKMLCRQLHGPGTWTSLPLMTFSRDLEEFCNAYTGWNQIVNTIHFQDYKQTL